MLADEIVDHSLRPALGQAPVVRLTASRVGVALDEEPIRRVQLEHFGELVDDAPGFRLDPHHEPGLAERQAQSTPLADRVTLVTGMLAEHPAVRSISHPQGRILNHRPPNAVDLEAVYAACVETGTALETNGLPDRIDLSSSLVRDAVRAGVAITCSTDAHSVRGLQNMRLAVATARRG